jgi:hypothetical protein
MSEPSRVGRFGGLAKVAKARGEVPLADPSAEAATHEQPEPAIPAPARPPEATKEAQGGKVPVTSPKPQRGAKAVEVGKSKREDYRQTTLYVQADLHADAFDKLRAEQRRAKKGEPRRDMSDVMGALLDGWVSGRFTV